MMCDHVYKLLQAARNVFTFHAMFSLSSCAPCVCEQPIRRPVCEQSNRSEHCCAVMLRWVSSRVRLYLTNRRRPLSARLCCCYWLQPLASF